MSQCLDYPEDEWLLLSGIQHFAFCRRQWALIHLEQIWEENPLTALGRRMHDTVHESGRPFEKRGALLITRGLPVHSRELGLSGVCDVVEFIEDADGVTIEGAQARYSPIPVEYKRGLPKSGDEDIVQVAAQALCLEEMLCCAIPKIALYYGKNKRRMTLALDDTLRMRVKDICLEMHFLAKRQHTPRAHFDKRCEACSLKEHCLPQLTRCDSVSRYLLRALQEE